MAIIADLPFRRVPPLTLVLAIRAGRAPWITTVTNWMTTKICLRISSRCGGVATGLICLTIKGVSFLAGHKEQERRPNKDAPTHNHIRTPGTCNINLVAHVSMAQRSSLWNTIDDRFSLSKNRPNAKDENEGSMTRSSPFRSSAVRIALGGIILMGFLATLMRWAVGPLNRPGPRPDRIVTPGIATSNHQAEAAGTLRIMTWNLAYARGTNPDNRVNRPISPSQLAQRLSMMAKVIRDRRVDILLVQEIDFDSKRSHHIDQMISLARESGLPFAAQAISWDARYVPFPYWPPTSHYGRVKSGGAILSRVPILENTVHLLPKPKNNPWWYNAFYLFRYSQWVSIKIGGQLFWIVNNHLEAFDKENRQEQAKIVEGLVQERSKRAPILVLGGDLNTVPPEAQRKHDFPDADNDDYRDDRTLGIFREITTLREIISREDYRASERTFFTFPTMDPTRRLDYLFVSNRATVSEVEFVETMDFSDHRPVLAEIRNFVE